MATLREWIEEAAAGEPVEAVVIGKMGWGDYGSERVPNYAECPRGKVLSWDEALPWLSYEFSSGFGSPGCQAIYAWTLTKVIFISQYDGATGWHAIPRNPVVCEPEMPGG